MVVCVYESRRNYSFERSFNLDICSCTDGMCIIAGGYCIIVAFLNKFIDNLKVRFYVYFFNMLNAILLV